MIWLSLNLDFLMVSPGLWRSLQFQLVRFKEETYAGSGGSPPTSRRNLASGKNVWTLHS
jgi:hypothetical protein